MKRNSTTLYLTSPGATTPIPWVNDTPDFSAFTEPTLSVLQKAWQDFVDSSEELEVIPDPEPFVESPTPDWDNFNVYMLSDPMFKSYRDIVRAADGDLNGALFDAYGLVAPNGVSAFSTIWGVWKAVSGITPTDCGTIADIAEGYNLPSDFVQVIRGN